MLFSASSFSHSKLLQHILFYLIIVFTISILAMDTLSASTAGVDAAKGKTLEEMSDLVGVVST